MADIPTSMRAFVADCAGSLDHADEKTELVLMFPDKDGVLVMECVDGAAVERAFATEIGQRLQLFRPQMAGMGSRIGWTNDDGPTRDAWMLVVVERDKPAQWLVRPVNEETWYLVPADEVPWLAASSAGGLRHWLETGEMPTIRHARDGDPRLFDPATRSNPPASQLDGKI